jgi:4'-phosphopantetheinyl transferase
MIPVRVTDGVHVAAHEITASATEPVLDLPPWRAREHSAARLLLRRLLAAVGRPATGPIASHATGQPFLPDHPDLTISLSHSGDWVAAAVGINHTVGIDVQLPLPAHRLLRRCCPAGEATLTALSPARRDLEFAWLWTAQESCVKATGQGLAGLPWTIPVHPGQTAGRWHDVTWRSLRDHYRVPVTCAYQEVPTCG